MENEKQEIDEDLIPYYKCNKCGLMCCKDEWDINKVMCIYCVNKEKK